ncbi:MAG: lysyl-tRNA synthetase class 2 [Halieaceae bacterium]|jgi:lysyl-tRNA synthetase class 2
MREFFAQRGVLEVETPLLSASTVTDPHIEALALPEEDGPIRYLQTSPEYAMKRLLASGTGPIFQICKAFRAGEKGGRHNPEFTMLEWYREGLDHHALMVEVEDLVRSYLDREPAVRLSYSDLFEEALGINPHQLSDRALSELALSRIDTSFRCADRGVWLNLLMTELVEPTLVERGLVFVYDYPAEQAALARLGKDFAGNTVAHRFELYVDGVELANGYYELGDYEELNRRFEQDNLDRSALGRPSRPVDDRLLAAMMHGLPSCSGVALGVDRLLMLERDATSISEVLAFDWDRS